MMKSTFVRYVALAAVVVTAAGVVADAQMDNGAAPNSSQHAQLKPR